MLSATFFVTTSKSTTTLIFFRSMRTDFRLSKSTLSISVLKLFESEGTVCNIVIFYFTDDFKQLK